MNDHHTGQALANLAANSVNSMHAGQALANFAANLKLDAIPAAVLDGAEDFLIDWLGSALAGKGARAVESIARFAESMAPADGPSEVLIHRRRTSPLAAAVANAASSHVAEQDDLHNSSVFHPATVVFPPALAVAQALGRSGADLLVAAVAAFGSMRAGANALALAWLVLYAVNAAIRFLIATEYATARGAVLAETRGGSIYRATAIADVVLWVLMFALVPQPAAAMTMVSPVMRMVGQVVGRIAVSSRCACALRCAA